MAQAQFVLTDAGIAAVIQAEEKGLCVRITDYTLGSAYGYEPSSSDTDMHGDLLYKGAPAKYKFIDQKTRLVVCEVPVEIGPFTFGEIALWLEDGTLFALCALESAVEKYSSLESSVASSLTLNCLLTVDQGASKIVIGYEDDPSSSGNKEIEIIDKWVRIDTPPAMGYDPFIEELIVQEATPDGRQTLLVRDSVQNTWDVASTWTFIGQAVPKAFDSTYVQFADGTIMDSAHVLTTPNFFLIQVGSTFRVATASIVTGADNAIRLTFLDAVNFSGSETVKVFQLDNALMQQLDNSVKDLREDIGQNFVTLDTTQTITGQKTFTETILGVAQYAQWADLAEFYEADQSYVPGTLIEFGGNKEITVAKNTANGVISTRPGFALNTGLKGGLPVALCGRVPIRIIGRVKRFDKIVLSDVPGVGCVNNKAKAGKVIGRALRSKHTRGEGSVLCATRFKMI